MTAGEGGGATAALASITCKGGWRRRMPCWQRPQGGEGGRFLAAAASATPSKARVGELFNGPASTLLLERVVGDRTGADAALWQSGAFRAEVYPDLPLATAWRDLLPRPWPGAGNSGTASSTSSRRSRQDPDSQGPGPLLGDGRQLGWRVQTLAAQLRGGQEVERLLRAAAEGSWPSGARPPDALLCVSGGHPVRMLPGVGSLLWSSFDTLQLAGEMRERGELPASLSLWAVENPMLNPVSRLQRKAEAGAQVVLTQPPLLWARSARWVEESVAQGLAPQQLQLVLGMPMVSSAGNLDFWLRLCGVRGLPEASDLLAAFPQQEALGHAAWQAAVRGWNAELIQRALALPGVSGLHVMPLNKVARQLTLQLLYDGTLPGSCLHQQL